MQDGTGVGFGTVLVDGVMYSWAASVNNTAQAQASAFLWLGSLASLSELVLGGYYQPVSGAPHFTGAWPPAPAPCPWPAGLPLPLPRPLGQGAS